MNAAILKTFEIHRIEEATIARLMRELQSDLAALVESGDLTPEEANEWANAKAEQWKGGVA